MKICSLPYLKTLPSSLKNNQTQIFQSISSQVISLDVQLDMGILVLKRVAEVTFSSGMIKKNRWAKGVKKGIKNYSDKLRVIK